MRRSVSVLSRVLINFRPRKIWASFNVN